MDNLIQHTHDILAANAKRWLLLADMPAELLQQTPAPNEWSAVDCLRHLLDTERSVFPARVEHILAGRDFPDFNPNAEGSPADASQTPKAMAEEFARLRLEGLNSLAKVTEADFPRTARHSKLGTVNMEELLHEWAGHDLMHTVQAERAVMQPLIAGTGPWRHYFKDHDVNAH